MAIFVVCECGFKKSVPDEWAGKRVKCKCGRRVVVGAEATPAKSGQSSKSENTPTAKSPPAKKQQSASKQPEAKPIVQTNSGVKATSQAPGTAAQSAELVSAKDTLDDVLGMDMREQSDQLDELDVLDELEMAEPADGDVGGELGDLDMDMSEPANDVPAATATPAEEKPAASAVPSKQETKSTAGKQLSKQAIATDAPKQKVPAKQKPSDDRVAKQKTAAVKQDRAADKQVANAASSKQAEPDAKARPRADNKAAEKKTADAETSDSKTAEKKSASQESAAIEAEIFSQSPTPVKRPDTALPDDSAGRAPAMKSADVAGVRIEVGDAAPKLADALPALKVPAAKSKTQLTERQRAQTKSSIIIGIVFGVITLMAIVVFGGIFFLGAILDKFKEPEKVGNQKQQQQVESLEVPGGSPTPSATTDESKQEEPTASDPAVSDPAVSDPAKSEPDDAPPPADAAKTD